MSSDCVWETSGSFCNFSATSAASSSDFATTLTALIPLLLACQPKTAEGGCTLHAPIDAMPEHVKRVHLGMTRAELEEGMGGPADYSPADGLYYFSTGGDCPLDEGERSASCGVVAEFRDDENLTTTLRSCRWGAIGE